jgi:hypothetical protein
MEPYLIVIQLVVTLKNQNTVLFTQRHIDTNSLGALHALCMYTAL